MIIDCDLCATRGLACGNCAATVIAGEEPELGPAELRALTVLANAGLIPPLRYAPRLAKAS
jgi:ferredoxin